MEPDKVHLCPAYFTTLIKIKLLQQVEDWFVRPVKRILCPLLFVRNDLKDLEMMITMLSNVQMR